MPCRPQGDNQNYLSHLEEAHAAVCQVIAAAACGCRERAAARAGAEPCCRCGLRGASRAQAARRIAIDLLKDAGDLLACMSAGRPSGCACHMHTVN